MGKGRIVAQLVGAPLDKPALPGPADGDAVRFVMPAPGNTGLRTASCLVWLPDEGSLPSFVRGSRRSYRRYFTLWYDLRPCGTRFSVNW